MRMVQARDRPRLTFEPGAELGRLGEVRQEDLDRDRAVEAGVAGAVHLAHPAGTERRLDFVGTKASTRREHGCGRL